MFRNYNWFLDYLVLLPLDRLSKLSSYLLWKGTDIVSGGFAS